MEDVIIKKLTKKFGGNTAVEDINLNIEKGSLFTFLGPSGCGKTTILRAISGFLKVDEGKIFLGERDITNVSPEKRDIGMVFQNYALFPHMTVYENVAYGLKIKRFSKQDIDKRVEKYLELVSLNGYEDRKISELSGGEQQRVALARSLVTEPKILLLDEPLCNLDAKLRIKMRNDIKLLQQKLGITTIFVTHDQEEALTMSHKIAVFNRGSCVQVGTPSEIYSNPKNSFVANFIGETNLFKIDSVSDAPRCIYIDEETKLDTEQDPSNKLFASIRPEHIGIKARSSGRVNEFKGIIERVQFNGNIINYLVKVKNIEVTVTSVNSLEENDKFFPLQEVYIEIPKNSVRLLKE
ncbi:ABC transporter ATP-binding protein [Propionigenium maris DSM 9537]|uniref:Spermidine/putrescine import ATP-binding protein PotA n=1 Tax=Propionigenium maris DSM 9537 TaxID=1123000 RepID=A0A9W6LLT1_9FUSO|nr:ABC transporter ATP-binding protein [Propionigenium maris]GLI55054.1 ABC transporter ATP-binding protein [Propionigenium maris DSM 9537]